MPFIIPPILDLSWAFSFFYVIFKIYFSLSLLGLLLCWLSLGGASRGYSLVAVCGLLIAVASLVAKHGL